MTSCFKSRFQTFILIASCWKSPHPSMTLALLSEIQRKTLISSLVLLKQPRSPRLPGPVIIIGVYPCTLLL